MFYIFIIACKRYKFTYALNAIHGISLCLHPYNSFGSIDIAQEYYEHNYNKLFFKAIKKMKWYRKEVGYH